MIFAPGRTRRLLGAALACAGIWALAFWAMG